MPSFIGNILSKGLEQGGRTYQAASAVTLPTTGPPAKTPSSRSPSVVSQVTGFFKRPGWGPPVIAATAVIAFLYWRSRSRRPGRRR